MKLIPQSKKLIKEMREAGYPTCLKKGDWPGNYPRHCNSCIKSYKNLITTQKYILKTIFNDFYNPGV
jgi:hypothetical protein